MKSTKFKKNLKPSGWKQKYNVSAVLQIKKFLKVNKNDNEKITILVVEQILNFMKNGALLRKV